jgi:hypothetical protein
MQRAGGSVLLAAGWEELIADTRQEYEDIAVRLMTDPLFFARFTHFDLQSSALFNRDANVEAMLLGIRHGWRMVNLSNTTEHIDVSSLLLTKSFDEL